MKPRKRRLTIWTLVLIAHCLVLFCLPLVIFSRKIFEKDSASVTIAVQPQQVVTIDIADRPRGVVEKADLPGAEPVVIDEPRLFFPSATESDHNESNDGEDYGQMKGDSKDAISYIPGTDGGVKSRQPGKGPGVNDSIGVGAGAGGSSRYGGRFGGRIARASGSGSSDEGKAQIDPNAHVEAARRLSSADDLRPKAPELVVQDGARQLPLELEALRVATLLEPTRARVLLDCTFKNPIGHDVPGEFTASLPEGASPCYLATFQGRGPSTNDLAALLPPLPALPRALAEGGLDLTNSLYAVWSSGSEATIVDWGVIRPARVQEQVAAKVVYEQTTRQRVDPALLEWSGSNRFSTKIFPIAARGRKRVLLAYDMAPRVEGQGVVLPLAVPSTLPAAMRLEVSADGRAFEKARVIHGEESISLEGDSKGFVGASLAPAKDAKGAFVLEASARAAVSAGFEKTEVGTIVHARFTPAARANAERETGDAVFLLDTSLSQRQKLAPSCAKLLRAILERDTTIRRFRVLAFDVATRELTQGWCKNSPQERAKLLEAVDAIWLEGATSLESALDACEKSFSQDLPPTFFLLSDGELTWGITEPRELERAHPRLFKERWIGYQIGDAPVNRPVLERLTASAGRIVSVASSGEIEAAALAHRATPDRLKSIKVEGVVAKDVVVAGSPRTIFPGQTLEVAFRAPRDTDPRPASIVVETDSGPQRFSLASAVEGDALSGRAWAELATGKLLALGDEDADKIALALSQRFVLANRVASFLILETDREYKRRELEPETLDVTAIADAVAARESVRPAGAPDLSPLAKQVRGFLETLRGKRSTPWTRPALNPSGERAPARPFWPARIDPIAVYRDAVQRRSAGATDDALRVLSSIVEENPRDGQALRIATYTLLAWGRFEEAASLAARTRALRPFEAQAWLVEAIALEALGDAPEAAARYELVLAQKFDARWENYAKQTAERLYLRLLASIGADLSQRWQQLTPDPGKRAFECVLFWNLEDTDIDLHVLEQDATEVFYSHPTSVTKGHLLWDNTAGLGPEVYEHPSRCPSECFVDYYGSRSIAGAAPAAAFLVVFREGESPIASCGVLDQKKGRTVLFRDAPAR